MRFALSFRAEAEDRLDGGFDVAVGDGCLGVIRGEGVEDFGDVTWSRTDVEDWGADGEDVVDLAGVNQANEGIAHDDDVEVGGGKGGGQVGKGLVGEGQ